MTLKAPSWQTRQTGFLLTLQKLSYYDMAVWPRTYHLPGAEGIPQMTTLRFKTTNSAKAWGNMETYMFPKQFLMKSQVLRELAHCIAPRLWLTETVRCYVCLVLPYSSIYPENYYYQCIHPNMLQSTCFSTLFLTVSMPNALVKSRHVVSILQV